MLKVINAKITELIQELTHCKVIDTRDVLICDVENEEDDIKNKLQDLHQDLESFKERVCSVQAWVKNGLSFYSGVEVNKKEEDDAIS